MELLNHERCVAGNKELRDILRRAEALVNRTGGATQEDLKAILARLLDRAPEIGDASHSETLDARLLEEVAEYVRNFNALQQVIVRIRSALTNRRAPSKAA
jgi:hypothetical protein